MRMGHSPGRSICFMSSECSGSNLLRILMGNQTNVSTPTPARLMPIVHSLLSHLSPLSEEENTLRLMEETLGHADHPCLGWDLALHQESAYLRHQPQGFLGSFTLFYEQKWIGEGEQRFVCRENDIFDSYLSSGALP